MSKRIAIKTRTTITGEPFSPTLAARAFARLLCPEFYAAFDAQAPVVAPPTAEEIAERRRQARIAALRAELAALEEPMEVTTTK